MAKFDPFLSLDCARVEDVEAQSKERKGSNFAAQRSGAIVMKPDGPNTYDLKFLLLPSGNHALITTSHHCCSSRMIQTEAKTTSRQKAMTGKETQYLHVD